MKQTARIISTYAADVSGVCSALFELGGMTIMHDASGCNSTYNTHDEPRWYDTDSLVYISGLSEIEAIMGDDEKIVG
ncbi:MAG: oxidoreductase, partial [Evtepia sp.]